MGPHEKGDPDKPLVIALHGFLQNVKHPWPRLRRWGNWEYWNFPAMCGLLDSCRIRGWSCYMPCARFKNWTPERDGSLMSLAKWRREAAELLGWKHAQPPIVMGFSDGASVVNSLWSELGEGEVHSLVSYSGTYIPPKKGASQARLLLVDNEGEKPKIRERVQQMATLSGAGRMTADPPWPFLPHRWEKGLNDKILDWSWEAPN